MSRLMLSVMVLAALALPPAAAAETASVVDQGEHLYGRYCISCHGPAGAGFTSPTPIGAGPLRSQSTGPGLGPSLQGVGALAADFYLRTGYMPLKEAREQPRRSDGVLTDRDVVALVAYVASLGPGPGIPHPDPASGNVADGQRLFTDHCSGCHQVAIAGGYLTGAIAPGLAASTPTQIAEAVRIGPYVMPRFSTTAISDQDLNSIIAYVQYAKNPDDRGGWAIGHLGPVPEGLVAWFFGAATLVALCMLIGARLRHA
jgi:ubiquinol-cytochrome c reductase cytochrome c subunit